MVQQKTIYETKVSLGPTFIVGLGRSGTTLLRNLLNASNQIHFPYESDFIARAHPSLCKRQSFSEDDYSKIAKAFSDRSQKNGWHMKESYLTSCLNKRRPQTFSDINAVIYESYLEQEGLENLQWGIKTPVLIQNLDRIIEVFPNAKIVHIVRDARDVYLSYKNINENGVSDEKFGPRNVVESALFWVDGVRKVEEFSSDSKSSSEALYELRFEDLLEDVDCSLTNVFSFLGMNYDPAIPESYLDHKGNQKLLCLQKYHEGTVKSRLREGIDKANTAKYLNKMTRLERFIFELIAIPYLKKYGYLTEFDFLSSPSLSSIREILYFAARKFNSYRYRRRDEKIGYLLSE
jgi:hypothetical protein